MDDMSKPSTRTERKCLRLEELEERIAPVIVDANPATWIQGLLTAIDGYTDNADSYWIFYLGPGQADIRPPGNGTTLADLNANFIDSITITGSTIDSALFVLDFPNDATPSQDDVPYPVTAGTLQVLGNITINGDMGCIEIDGLYGDASSAAAARTMTVHGTLGKFDVGILQGNINVLNGGNIYELDVDSLIGTFYDITTDTFFGETDVTISAQGNIGAIRVGVGLTDQGADINSANILGGSIAGSVSIRANSDGSPDHGIIDLIEVRKGSLALMGSPGSFGLTIGDSLPSISAGPAGNIRFMHIDGDVFTDGTQLNTVFVTATSSSAERTVVDDSGGVLVVHPHDTNFTAADGTITTHAADVEMLLIPVNHFTQGPGVVIARLVASGSNDFTVSGDVEIGDFQIGQETNFPEGLTADLARLGVASIDLIPNDFATLTSLTGFAHDTINEGEGGGHADIYFLDSMAAFNNPGTVDSGGRTFIIPIVLNNTPDGDINAVGADRDIMLVSASRNGGDIGSSSSISPFILRGPLNYFDGNVAWVDIASGGDTVTPTGIEGSLTRYNSIYGVFCSGSIFGLRAGGAIGDVRLPLGNVRLMEANSNDVRDPGSPLMTSNIVPLTSGLEGGGLFHPDQTVSFFGRIQNTIGDGVYGKVFSGVGADFPDNLQGTLTGGGIFTLIKVGEGLEVSMIDGANLFPTTSPFTTPADGAFVASGIFTGGSIDTVVVSGHGRAIFGAIIAQTNDAVNGFAINHVKALDGARLDGTRSIFLDGSGALVIIAGNSGEVFNGGGVITGNINTVTVDGTGAIMDSLKIVGHDITSIVATDSTDGIVNSRILTVEGSLGRIAAGGPGMDNVSISIHGPARTIETTGPTSIMTGCDVLVRGVLGRLSTNALAFDDIDILTIGSISDFDFIQGSALRAGGLRTINVHNDVFDGSLIQVAGPLDRLNVGGDIADSTIEATGQFGDIGTITVKGSITNSDIFSNGSIAKIVSGGSIDASITTMAITKHTPTTIIADGTVSGNWQFTNELKSLKTTWLGNVNAVINATSIGTITADGAINGNITTVGNAGKIIARGNVNSDISVGNNLGSLESTEGSIRGDVIVIQRVGSVIAANDVGSTSGPLHSVLTAGGPVGKILAGSSMTVGDVVADVSVFERVNSIQATGDVTGIIDIGALGTMKAAGAIIEDIDIAGKAGSIMSGGMLGHLGSHLNVGGSLGRLSVGTLLAPANNVSDVGIGGKLGSLAVTGDMPGNLTVGDAAGKIAIGGDAGQSGQLWQIGKSLGRMDVGRTGVLSDLIAAVDIGDNLGRLNVTGDLFDDFSVGQNAGTIDIGRVIGSPADLTLINIGGSLNKIISGSVFVEVTPHFFNIFDSGIHTGDLTVTGAIKHPPL